MSFPVFEVYNKDNNVLSQNILWYHLFPHPCKNIYSQKYLYTRVAVPWPGSGVAACLMGDETCLIETLFFSIFFKTEENGSGWWN